MKQLLALFILCLCYFNAFSNNKIEQNFNLIFNDSSKIIRLYTVNNKTNEIIAKIDLTIIVNHKKITQAEAKVLENKLDGFNSVKELVLKIENGWVILQVQMEGDIPPSNTDKDKWFGEIGASIFLYLTKEGNLKSLTNNMPVEDSDLRFGGIFLDQANGVFKTTTIKTK